MEPEEKKQPNNTEQVRPGSIETYTDDMVKTLESEQGGTIKKIIHEEEERSKQKKNVSPQSMKNRVFMIVGFILIILAFGAIASVALLGQKVSTVPLTAPFSPAVFTDKNSFYETKDLISQEIPSLVAAKAAATSVKAGGIEGIFLTDNGQNVSFSKLMSLLKGHFPSNGFSSVKNFLLGSYNGADGKDLVLLLKTTSFTDIFPAMQAWETKMFSDLAGMFGVEITADNNYLQTKHFTDDVIDNKNARVLYDKSGNIALMYIFADDNSVIVTQSIPAAEEVMSRLSNAKVAK